MLPIELVASGTPDSHESVDLGGFVVAIVVGGVAHVPPGAGHAPADLSGLLTALGHARADGATLLVAVTEEGLAAARSARVGLADPDLGVLECLVPPTRVFLVAAALATLPAMALGLASAVIRAVEQATTTRALLSSVAGLTRPRPSLWLDATSYLPGRTYLVDWDVGSVSTGSSLDLAPGRLAVVNRSAKPLDPAEPLFAGERVDLTSDGTFWGAKRWWEVSVMASSLDDVVDRALVPDAVAAMPECPSCGRASSGEVCAFCQIPVAARTEPVLRGVR